MQTAQHVRLEAGTEIERAMKRNAHAARERLFRAKPKAIAKPYVHVPKPYDDHIFAFYRYWWNKFSNNTDRPRRNQVAGDMMTVCPFDWNDLLSKRRTREMVVWRQALMEALKRYTPMSLPEIGRFLGGKDHTTVLHAIRKVEAAVDAGDVELHSGPLGFEFRVRTGF